MTLPDTPDRTHVPLEYESGEPIRRRRRRFRLILAVVAGTLLGLGWWAGPRVIRIAKLAFYQRQVARYSAPANRVVYEEDPSRWPVLLAQAGYRQFTAGGAGWNNYVGYTAGPVQSLAQ